MSNVSGLSGSTNRKNIPLKMVRYWGQGQDWKLVGKGANVQRKSLKDLKALLKTALKCSKKVWLLRGKM